MEERTLVAHRREGKGKEEARRLRHQGLIPAVVYGHREETIPITLDPKELFKILRAGAGERTLINLTIEGLQSGPVTKTVILKEKQVDPVKRTVLHADLYTVAMDEKIDVSIPVHIVGKSQGVELGGVLEQVLREIEVECLPGDIPPGIDVDVSALDIGDSIHVSDIALEKAKILVDPEQTIVTVVPPTVYEEPVVEEEVVEVEAAEEEEGEKKEEKAEKEEAAEEGSESG
jgi:large subunit ribosomal protein L25